MIELKGMAPAPATLEQLKRVARGRCLDLGTGTGASALVMAGSPNVDRVLTVENNPDYYKLLFHKKVGQSFQKREDVLYGIDLKAFDFVFVDHLPIHLRSDVAHRCCDAGLAVLVDDAIAVELDSRFSAASNYAWSE